MSDEPKSDHLKVVPPPAPESVFDDVEALRKVATLKVSRRVVPVNVAVRKPPNNVYFRVPPGPGDVARRLGPDRRWRVGRFLFRRAVHAQPPRRLPRLRKVTIAIVYTWPGGAVSLWPVPNVEETRIACWKSARAAFELAKEQWVQLCLEQRHARLRRGGGGRYQDRTDLARPTRHFATCCGSVSPTRSSPAPEHPYVKQLRGLAD